ncbi:hypothetical protein J0X20_02205 [Streptomyces sp. KCTC 0041BP]|uniref:hypothetical protein n=1 Tax=Streptomyces sp. KCTC 0041BP TaxID=201500 RepID=UPI001AE69771|nr:hypothetical protein [Streptomyces sp. KCTC 0041BP]MBP0932457.1 hypothetical protein [Streptomyces sp. KCTC 0041BP]
MTTSPPPAGPPSSSPGHLPLPYEETTDPHYAQEVVRNHALQQVKKDDYVIVFTCPRCGAAQEDPLFEPGFRSLRTAGAPAAGVAAASSTNTVLPMSCRCRGDIHAGCPDGRSGCGAYWTVEMV